MTVLAILGTLIAASSSLLSGQERPVPKDSARLSISGCAHGRVFTVGRSPEHELRGTELQEGRKIRLEGPKQILADIKSHEGSMVVLTGLMRRSDIDEPGISVAGGRVRIAPGPALGTSAARDPGPQPAVVDVESWRLLNSSCPSR
jgi:hypothetical protein